MSGLKAQIICDVDQRDAERYTTNEQAEALAPGVESLPCILLDISETGARVALKSDNTIVPNTLKIYIAERDLIADCKVVWRKGKEFGVSFETTAVL